MAGDRLEAIRETYESSLRQMRTLLDAQASLREVAEQRAADTRAELERLAEALCPQLIDELRKEHPSGSCQVEARDLTNAVIREVQRRLVRLSVAEVAGQSVEELYEEATAELIQLRVENARLENELDDAHHDRDHTSLRLRLLEQSVENAQRRNAGTRAAEEDGRALATLTYLTDTPSIPPEQLPDWLSEWQKKKSHERDLALLSVLAETGVPTRDEVTQLLALRLELTPASTGVKRAFERCQERLGLIDLIDCSPSQQGNCRQQLVRLTERGRYACRLLLNVEAVPSQVTELLARHLTVERAALNIETARLLREAGYQVDLLPGPLHLSEDRLFTPDLLASHHGRTLTVAVEPTWGAHADKRNNRWQDYHEAGGGELYVAVPDRQTLDEVKSDILFWMGTRQAILRMTDLSAARGKKGDAVWLFRRDRRA